MQFTETIPPAPPLLSMTAKSQVIVHNRTRPWPGLIPSPKAFASFGDANCMEQLLVHCANAIDTNDATLAQQILWVLHNTAPSDGDSSQRLTCGFLRALISRAASTGSCNVLLAAVARTVHQSLTLRTHRFSAIELASFVDLTPWHRFGFTAANASIVEAIEGFSVVHIVDLSSTHCMQIPTLIDMISNRLEVPPLVKLTVAHIIEEDSHVPPMLDSASLQDLGLKLVNFARSRNVPLEFRMVPSSYKDGFASLIEHVRVSSLVYKEISSEALIINCHMMLHYIPEETAQLLVLQETADIYFETSPAIVSPRTMFLKSIRSLDPTMVVVVDEDVDFTSSNLVTRLRSAFNYLWIPYDTIDTFLPRGSKQREWYEGDVCWKIENVVAREGGERVERQEPKSRWVQRMRNAGFRGLGFGEEAVTEAKAMLDEHAAGWGMKKEEEEHLVLTWKGHNVVFATAWLPC